MALTLNNKIFALNTYTLSNAVSKFVVQSHFINNGTYSNLFSKEPNDKGAREFWKLISFLSFRDRLALQRAPLFNPFQFFKMQSQKNQPVSAYPDTTATLTSAAPSSTHSIDQVLRSFYENNDTGVVKQSLWQLLYLALGSEEFEELTPTERSNLAFQYKELTDLFDELHNHYSTIKM